MENQSSVKVNGLVIGSQDAKVLRKLHSGQVKFKDES